MNEFKVGDTVVVCDDTTNFYVITSIREDGMLSIRNIDSEDTTNYGAMYTNCKKATKDDAISQFCQELVDATTKISQVLTNLGLTLDEVYDIIGESFRKDKKQV